MAYGLYRKCTDQTELQPKFSNILFCSDYRLIAVPQLSR